MTAIARPRKREGGNIGGVAMAGHTTRGTDLVLASTARVEAREPKGQGKRQRAVSMLGACV